MEYFYHTNFTVLKDRYHYLPKDNGYKDKNGMLPCKCAIKYQSADSWYYD